MSEHTEQFRSIATEALAASTITESEAPPTVADAYEEAATGVSALLAIAETTEQKLGELAEQRSMIPKTGYEERKREILANAQSLAQTAERQFRVAVEQTEAELLSSALPTLESDTREGLARQELDVALGDAKGAEVKARLLGIARSGSPELQAVLRTPYARTALIARGVSDPTPMTTLMPSSPTRSVLGHTSSPSRDRGVMSG